MVFSENTKCTPKNSFRFTLLSQPAKWFIRSESYWEVFLLTKADLILLAGEKVIDFHNLKFTPCSLVHRSRGPHMLFSEAQCCSHIRVQMASDTGTATSLRHAVNVTKYKCQRAEAMPVFGEPVRSDGGHAPSARPHPPGHAHGHSLTHGCQRPASSFLPFILPYFHPLSLSSFSPLSLCCTCCSCCTLNNSVGSLLCDGFRIVLYL